MRSTSTSPRALIAVLAIIGLAVGAFAFVVNASAGAQVVTDFNLSVTNGGLPTAGGSSDVTIALTPGSSAIAAVGGTVTYDSALVSPTGCVALVGLGACNLDTPGVVTIQTVDAAGWAVPTDLFRLTFTSIALVDAAPLVVIADEAYDQSGASIAGETTNGEIVFRVNGDVNCSDSLSIADALFIAQYAVGNRVGVTECPLGDPATEINLTYADLSQDDRISTLDALLVAQCSVGNRDCEA